MEKNSRYWELHKIEYQKIFDELDKQIKEIVSADPNSDEARGLNLLVEKAIYDKLKKVKI